MSMRSDRARRRAERRRNQRIILILIGVVLLSLFAYVGFTLWSGRDSGDADPTPAASGQATVTASGLQIEILQAGTGEAAQEGDTVTVHYTGTLQDGTVFDSSFNRNQPATFLLARGSVIQGWVEGVAGMQIGEKRRLTIPPDLGYGPGGNPPVIPGNATLIFDVELLAINP